MTLQAGQTLFIAALAYDGPNGTGAESKLAAAKITHYEGGVDADGFESARTDYTVSFTITARDADGEQVKLHYRSVTTVSDSYTSPTPTSTSLNNQPFTPAAVMLDRGMTDRIFEWWAEDASGNKSAIERLAIPAITASAAAAAVNTVTNSTAFVGTCPTSNMEDTVTWTTGAGVPAGWLADIRRCTSGTSCTPVTIIATDQVSGFQTNFRTAVQAGVSGPDQRCYGINLKNSYGETVEAQDAPSGLSTTFDACP